MIQTEYIGADTIKPGISHAEKRPTSNLAGRMFAEELRGMIGLHNGTEGSEG